MLEAYARKDNALFVPESGDAAAYPRYFFAALGHGAIGWSPFGLELTGYANAPLGAPLVDDKLIDLFALNYEIVESVDRELVRLNFEGKLQAVAEDPAVHQQTMQFGPWIATVSYGLRVFGRRKSARKSGASRTRARGAACCRMSFWSQAFPRVWTFNRLRRANIAGL